MHSLYYIYNGNFPGDNAHCVFLNKHAQSLAADGWNVSIIAPRRLGHRRIAIEGVTITYLPTIDLFRFPIPRKIAFYINEIVFLLFTFLYLLVKSDVKTIVMSASAGAAWIATFTPRKVVYDMHDFLGNPAPLYRSLIRRADLITTQNEWKKNRLVEKHDVPKAKINVEPNGVTFEDFSMSVSQKEAREHLNIRVEGHVAVYTGSLLDWKGADILALAAKDLPEDYTVYFVGGSKKDMRQFKSTFGDVAAIRLVGHQPHELIPYWQAAADVLVAPNTGRQDISKYYTSPMKLFEYMASRRPIIASRLPSVRAVLDDKRAILVEPDNPKELTRAIVDVVTTDDKLEDMIEAAYQSAKQYTWKARAQRLGSVLKNI